jgi:hypothetical protein
MLKTKLIVMTLPWLLVSQFSFAGSPQPGQQGPGQQNPGQQNPGQQNPGQQNPGQQDSGKYDSKIHKFPEFGVELGVVMYQNRSYVYVHKLTHEFGTLARLGLHNGDIIHSIAYQTMASPLHVHNMMKHLEAQCEKFEAPIEVQLTIARGGKWYSWQASLN